MLKLQLEMKKKIVLNYFKTEVVSQVDCWNDFKNRYTEKEDRVILCQAIVIIHPLKAQCV